MRAPGRRLRALASLVCRAETLEHLIDPVVADLQLEYASAANESRWTRGVIRCRGYFAFWTAAAAHTGVVVGTRVRQTIVQDDWAGGHVLGIAAVAGAVVMAAMVIFPLTMAASILSEQGGLTGDLRWTLPLLLVPQALPIAVPAGLLCGIFYDLGRRRVAVLVRPTILAVAILGSLFSFVMLDAVVPKANQAYRVAVFQRLGHSDPPARGANELTLRELSARIVAAEPFGARARQEMRMLRLSYHEHVALSLTPLVFGLMGLGLAGRIRKHPIVIGLAVVTLFSSYFVMYPFYGLVGDGTISPVIVAWTPNLVALVVAVASAAHARRLLETS